MRLRPAPRGHGRIGYWVGTLAALFLVWWLVVYQSEALGNATLAVLSAVEELGPWGPMALIAAVTLSMLLVLPGFPFTLAAGFLFGVVEGTFCVFVGTVAGGSLAFFSGRYLFHDRLTKALEQKPRVRRFVDAMAQEGWRFVMFTRMVPMFPFKLSNYAFGATEISYRQFALGMSAGIVPLIATNVYAGSLLGNLSLIQAEDESVLTRNWTLYIAGFVVLLSFAAYIAHLARGVLNPYMDSQDEPLE